MNSYDNYVNEFFFILNEKSELMDDISFSFGIPDTIIYDH